MQAIQLYQRNGYHRIESYGHYQDKPESTCFEKILK